MSKENLILSNCSNLNTYTINRAISDLPGIISVYMSTRNDMIIEYESNFISKIDIVESVSLMGEFKK